MCRTLQIMGVLRKSVQIPHGPDCAGVCSSTIHVHAVTLWIKHSVSGVALEWLGKWTLCDAKRRCFWKLHVPSVGMFTATVIFHSHCAGERGKHSGVWQEQHAATKNSCLDTSQVFLHFPLFHLSLCLQWCTCPFKRICAVRGVCIQHLANIFRPSPIYFFKNSCFSHYCYSNT